MHNILLGVTGGIACYKSPDLVRRLMERGANVQVVMTAGAEAFVTPLTFQAVSGRLVRTDLFDEQAEAAMGHIELARWADQVVIAPASADFIARFTAGMGDDLLTTVCLATEAPIAIAPAMNRQMWASKSVVDNVATLVDRGVTILGPGAGDQACGETGSGRMLEPIEIAERVMRPDDGVLAGTQVVISAGPTREPLDPVRYLTNRSSGKMGFALAAAALRAGANVTLVAGPCNIDAPMGVHRIDVETALEMDAAVQAACNGADVFISAAAVSDYRPTDQSAQKIKKTDDELALTLVRSPDILKSISARDSDRPFCVGFAAETEDVREYALGKMRSKKLDMIIANQVGDKLAFDQDDNAVTVYWPDGETAYPMQAKTDLAVDLIACIATHYHKQQNS
ncbi:MAG: bifunctional phosphopantothenoylcysteine decarboxylase/phosphopantothenate--cysteine ligase CoaBC [Pseudomonadota bacterium]